MGSTTSTDGRRMKPKLSGARIRSCFSKAKPTTLTSLEPVLDPLYENSPRTILISILSSNKYNTIMSIPLEDLEFQSVVGRSKYGDIRKAVFHGTPVLVKYMPPAVSSATMRLFENDLHLLMSLRHPNIVQVIGASWSSPPTTCFVMEYLERGDLFNLLHNSRNTLSWVTNLLTIAIGAARGMAYLHGHTPPILHRNLKSSSIHVGADYSAKISGFAVRREHDFGSIRPRDVSYYWMSPELLRGDRCTFKTDVYSFGILLSELDTRSTPYHNLHWHVSRASSPTSSHLIQGILHDDLRPELSSTPMESLEQLYRRCVAADPRRRPAFEEILEILETDNKMGSCHSTEQTDPEPALATTTSLLAVSEEHNPQEASVVTTSVVAPVPAPIAVDPRPVSRPTEADPNVPFGDFKEGERNVVETILESKINLRMAAINFKELKLQKVIGKGAFGEVIKGTYHGTPVVVKRMVRQNIDPENVRMFAEEIQLMMNLRHPNIVQFIGASWNSYSNICFVTEFLDRGDLYSVLKNPRIQLSWHHPLWGMTIDISRGMAYLHSMDPPIIHRDLKSMNILVSSSFGAKISDFGLSREKAMDDTMSVTGTP
ncbi:kinase, partial [Thraustotheca clavata]